MSDVTAGEAADRALHVRARPAGAESDPPPVQAFPGVRPARTASSGQPLVSIIMFVRNGMPHLERAARSVLAQSYENFEFVVQDGASSDDTVAYLRALDDPRIKVISEPDAGPADAFAKALSRCQGDIVASCLADEELMPDALSRAVAIFEQYPHLGAITGDALISDLDGCVYDRFVGAPFNLVNYLNGDYCPYWCSSFFSMSALRFIGLFDERWSRASLEFEIWCRLAMETDILYVPETFAKYAHHSAQLSQTGPRVAEELESRVGIIRDRMFGKGKYFGEDYGLRDVFTLLQLVNLYRHLSTWNPNAAKGTLDRIVQLGYLLEFNTSRGDGPPPPVAVAVAPPPVAGVPAVAFEPFVLPAEPVNADGSPFIPMHELIIPRERRLGRFYRKLTPRALRALIPRNLKVAVAYAIGLRRR